MFNEMKEYFTDIFDSISEEIEQWEENGKGNGLYCGFGCEKGE